VVNQNSSEFLSFHFLFEAADLSFEFSYLLNQATFVGVMLGEFKVEICGRDWDIS